MRADVARFLAEHHAAYDVDVDLANKAGGAYDEAYCFLANFTLSNAGLTPDEAKKLLQLMGDYQHALTDADSAQVPKADAIRRLDLAFRSPVGPALNR